VGSVYQQSPTYYIYTKDLDSGYWILTKELCVYRVIFFLLSFFPSEFILDIPDGVI